MPLSPTSRLGPYEILALLGAGGMGEVYKARDTRLNRIVAVKVSNEQFSERFEREAHAVASLNHSHVCTLNRCGHPMAITWSMALIRECPGHERTVAVSPIL